MGALVSQAQDRKLKVGLELTETELWKVLTYWQENRESKCSSLWLMPSDHGAEDSSPKHQSWQLK